MSRAGLTALPEMTRIDWILYVNFCLPVRKESFKRGQKQNSFVRTGRSASEKSVSKKVQGTDNMVRFPFT